jgi:hypothetical protein
MRGPWNSMADLLDESIKEKYRQYFVNDPLKFIQDALNEKIDRWKKENSRKG